MTLYFWVVFFFLSTGPAPLPSRRREGLRPGEPPPPQSPAPGPALTAPSTDREGESGGESRASRERERGGEEGPSSRCPPRQGKGGRAVREAPKGRETPQPVGTLWGKLRPDARRVTVVRGCRLLRAPHLLMTCLFFLSSHTQKSNRAQTTCKYRGCDSPGVCGWLQQAGSQASNHHPGEQHGHPASSATWLFLTRWRSGEHVPVSPLAAAPCSRQVQTEFLSYRKVHANAAFLQQKPVNYVAKPSIKLISDFELTGASLHSKLPQDPLCQPFAGLLSAWILPFPSSQKPL